MQRCVCTDPRALRRRDDQPTVNLTPRYPHVTESQNLTPQTSSDSNGSSTAVFPRHFTKRALIILLREKCSSAHLVSSTLCLATKARGLNQKACFILLKQVMLKSQNSRPSNWLVSPLNGNGKFSVFPGRWKLWFSPDQPHVNRTDWIWFRTINPNLMYYSFIVLT